MAVSYQYWPDKHQTPGFCNTQCDLSVFVGVLLIII